MHPSTIEPPPRQIETKAAFHAYPIGSRKRAITRLLRLLISFSVILVALYWLLAKFTPWPSFLFLLIVVLTTVRRAFARNAGGMWAVFFMKDSAYGWVTDSGIQYHTSFHARSNVLRWSQMSQMDYFSTSGRVTVYLRDKTLPIQFGPCDIPTLTGRSALNQFLKCNVESCGTTFIKVDQ